MADRYEINELEAQLVSPKQPSRSFDEAGQGSKSEGFSML
jgi:hypothetical protein